MNEHLSVETLAAFADGRLDAGPRRAAESHLSLCRICRRELAEVVDMLAGGEAAPASFVDRALAAAGAATARSRPAAKAMGLRPAFGVAAAFLVAVVAGYFFIGRGRVQAPPAGERELPEQVMAQKTARAPEGTASRKDAAAARDEMTAGRDEGVPAERDGTAAEAPLKKNEPPAVAARLEAVAEGKGEERRPAPTALDEAGQAVPAPPERFQAADKREPGEAEALAGGVAGGVLGGSREAQSPEKAKSAAAPAAEPRRRDLEAAPRAEMRLQGPGDAGAGAGARQLLLAASGRAAAPPSLEMVELAAGPLLIVEGDVARADVLPPGLRDARAWLPAGTAVEVTIDAGGEVSSVRLLGDWRPAAAARARAAAARLAFPPAATAERRAVISRPRFN